MNRNQHNMFSSMVNQAKCTGICKDKTITCTVMYKNKKWIFTAPGEKTVTIRDSFQCRTIIALLINMGSSMEPDDLESAVLTEPVVVHSNPSQEDTARSNQKTDDDDLWGDDDDGTLEADENESHGENEDGCDSSFALEGKFRSGSDPDLIMLYGIKQPRHTGDTCDYQLVRDIDGRVATLDVGIEAALSRGNMKRAVALGEEKTALRKWRNSWYVNPITGKVKPFYSKGDEAKALRCRMWISRGLKALKAKGLEKAYASMDAAISRGMKFQYDAQPGYEWVVTLPPHGSLPTFDKPRGGNHAGSKVAA